MSNKANDYLWSKNEYKIDTFISARAIRGMYLLYLPWFVANVRGSYGVRRSLLLNPTDLHCIKVTITWFHERNRK